jgi:hypothetical protein
MIHLLLCTEYLIRCFILIIIMNGTQYAKHAIIDCPDIGLPYMHDYREECLLKAKCLSQRLTHIFTRRPVGSEQSDRGPQNLINCYVVVKLLRRC